MAARRPSVLPMDLSSLLDSFTPEARPVRRASVMLTEQICHSINTLAPAVSVEQRGLIDQISTQGKAGSAAEAERIYHQLAVEQPKLTASPSILNAALDCHAKCQDGSARAAIRLFDTAVDAGQAYDVVTYNTVINAMAKKNDGSARAADRLLGRMRADSMSPTLVTFNTLIDAHSRQPDGSARAALTHLSQLLDDGIVPDQSTFTTVINLQARLSDGSAAAAFKVLDHMRRVGVPPNTIILNSVIDAQSKQTDGKARVALLVLEAMRTSEIVAVQPNVVTYTAVIDCTAKCQDGDALTALQLLQEMADNGLAPNHITYGTLINSMAKRGSARAATDLLKQMITSGLKPTLVAFNSVLHAHARGDDGSAAEALVLLQTMKEHGLSPNTISYSSCIDAQAKKPDGSAETAAQLLERAVSEGVVPDKVMFTAVFDAHAKRRDGSPKRAAAVLEMMSTTQSWVSPNDIHFNAVMNACASARPADITTAKRVLSLMTKRFNPNEYTLSAMLRCCAFSEPSEPEAARQIFKQFGSAITINDHVERALRSAVCERVADELFAAVGHTPTTRRRRRSSNNSGRFGSDRRDYTPVRRTLSDADTWRLPTDEAYSSMGNSSTSDEEHHSPPLSRADWSTFGRAAAPLKRSQSDRLPQSNRASAPAVIKSSPWSTFGKKPTEGSSAFASTMMTARKLSLSANSLKVPTDQRSGGSRRGSLAGSAALEVASIPRLNTEVVSGISAALNGNERQRRPSLAEKVAAIKASTESEKAPADSAPTRLSLSERVALMRVDSVSAESTLGANEHDEVPRRRRSRVRPDVLHISSSRSASDGSDCSSSSPPLLLSPDHFQSKISAQPDTVRMQRNVRRLPDNPDGSRGFGARRRASIDRAAMLMTPTAVES
mmetsp:Transcript_7020/g.17991  ORF Transcript_7020/g.17991 Transcript_7020/m.17991 type:complete len:893 (-) Transcript_7020:62-2740(-)|eukprot:CAMPEP_0182925350 /NCGR_PEP_ID=MMETSP0105_2-20130417/9363_1 /TAXON_ID=81532 ORGANISM="Acanthoeca-like sp., Strain 10tr" /NCGR_SAMPLE_ID=MMETSP0105_2 /ASSEMBLY_ACC=CAM_ASM_000205 /LENGTH=892 /DNA_ID=CAMNT_0025063197 /DNA_START=188 /DNA_END=2866 /DNA_ORIENTATION=-